VARCTLGPDPELFKPPMADEEAVADEGVVVMSVKGEPLGTAGTLVDDCAACTEFESVWETVVVMVDSESDGDGERVEKGVGVVCDEEVGEGSLVVVLLEWLESPLLSSPLFDWPLLFPELLPGPLPEFDPGLKLGRWCPPSSSSPLSSDESWLKPRSSEFES